MIAAVCPATGGTDGIIMPHLDASVINLFLMVFSAQLASDVHAVILWDGAGFHTSGEVEVPSNVSLIRLPPYAPELNPIENLWHYLRSHHWSNRFYPEWEDLKEAAVTGICAVGRNVGLIKNVCATSYL